METITLLLLISLPTLCRAQGCLECGERDVSANGTLELLLEEPPQRWVKVEWSVRLDGEDQQRCFLMAEKNKHVQIHNHNFSGRAHFQEENSFLSISPISQADSGVYWVKFQDRSGVITERCFHVKVWEPIHHLSLETRVLRQKQSRCDVLMLCTAPGAGNVSSEWSCPGGIREPQPRLQLQVLGDADPNVCRCTASNLANCSTAIAGAAERCLFAASELSWSYCRVKTLLCLLGLGSLAAAVTVTHVLVRSGDRPPGALARTPQRGGKRLQCPNE